MFKLFHIKDKVLFPDLSLKSDPFFQYWEKLQAAMDSTQDENVSNTSSFFPF